MRTKNYFSVVLAVLVSALIPLISHAGLNEDLLALVQGGWNKNLDKIRPLIDQGADVNAKNTYGDTSLIIAARYGSNKTVKILLEKGADVSIRSANGWTPLIHAVQRLHNNNNPELSIEIINDLLARGANLEAKTKDGETALFLSVINGDTIIAKYLMDKGADVNVRLPNGESPLIRASQYNGGRNPIMKALIDKGADVNARTDTKLSAGYTTLIFAAWKGNTEIVTVLLEKGADVNAKTRDGETALIYAAGQGKGFPDIVRALLAKGAAVNSVAQGNYNKTALTAAAQNGNTEIVKMLLDQGANVHAKTKEDGGGKTSLISAAEGGHASTVKLLLEKGANPNSKTTYGDTALKLAKKKGSTEVIDMLKQAGAKE